MHRGGFLVSSAVALVALGSLALTLATPGTGRATPSAQNPVVVELFTSQGCSSCPPANANLATVSDQPGVLALSFGVTYWDYLGWKDSFAKREFTSRQYNYVRTLHRATAYTPQMVVNGASDLVGNELDGVEQAIANARAAVARQAATAIPSIAIGSGEVAVGAAMPPANPADVWLVRYDPSIVQVPVARGENGGRTLPHKNVVHELTRLGGWSGAAARFTIAPSPEGMKTAILVQSSLSGEIIAAASD